MVRQYRIDHLNGLEILVCEVFRKHQWTQIENEALNSWILKNSLGSIGINKRSSFLDEFNDWLHLEHDSTESFYGLTEPIPTFDYLPCIVLRGAIVDNRIASLQVDYIGSVVPPVIVDEVKSFYDFLRSPHWRNTISCQLEQYGSLFGSDND